MADPLLCAVVSPTSLYITTKHRTMDEPLVSGEESRYDTSGYIGCEDCAGTSKSHQSLLSSLLVFKWNF